MSELSIASRKTLSDGRSIPLLGLGVWQILRGSATEDAVTAAVDAGYRHIDTAKIYGNEDSVGTAVRAAKERGVDDVWVTTKLFPTDSFAVESAFEKSYRKIGKEVLDCYLIHFPPPGLLTSTWRRFEALQRSGRVATIGVSNFGIRHLEAIRKECRVMPAINQIQLHPWCFDRKLVDYCADAGIAVEAYSPLTRGKKLGDPLLTEIAETHGVTAAQVLIRWCLQHEFIVIPKSARRERIVENAAVYGFALTDDEMDRLDHAG